MSIRPRRPPRWPAWLALLAVWSLALLPTLSQALAAHTGEAGWVEVCTVQGARWVPMAPAGAAGDAASGKPAGSAAVAFEHCPWCGSHAGDAVPPAPAASLLAPARGEPLATVVRRGAPAAPPWPDARPRAPPRIAA